MSKYCNSADKVKMLEPSQHFNPGFIIASKSIFWSQGSHLGQIWSQWVTFVNVNYQLLTWGDKKLQGKTAGKCPRYVGAENATFPLLFENISLLLQMWENNHCSITSRSARVALVRLACNEVGLNNYWYTFHSGWSQSERRWWIWVAGGGIPPCRKCTQVSKTPKRCCLIWSGNASVLPMILGCEPLHCLHLQHDHIWRPCHGLWHPMIRCDHFRPLSRPVTSNAQVWPY